MLSLLRTYFFVIVVHFSLVLLSLFVQIFKLHLLYVNLFMFFLKDCLHYKFSAAELAYSTSPSLFLLYFPLTLSHGVWRLHDHLTAEYTCLLTALLTVRSGTEVAVVHFLVRVLWI